jgi:hypothetical protein
MTDKSATPPTLVGLTVHPQDFRMIMRGGQIAGMDACINSKSRHMSGIYRGQINPLRLLHSLWCGMISNCSMSRHRAPMKKFTKRIVSILLPNLLTISIVLTLSVMVHATEDSDWKIAPESDWKLVAENANLKYYIDKQSIQEYKVNSCWYALFPWYSDKDFGCSPDRSIRAWVKKISKTPKQYEAREELDYQEDDCTKSRSRLLHLTRFYPDGINESLNLTAVIKWDSIPPHTAAEFIHKYLCKSR